MIIVPLDLPAFEIVSQCIRADGSIEVQVRASKASEACPTCGKVSAKIHDTRKRVKQDITLGNYQISLIVNKRRFRCVTCRRPFTETDSACGRYKRTTERLRQQIAKQACQRPITHVAQEMQVGPRFVHGCLCVWVEQWLEKKGRTLDEQAKLPTPQILGIDEFALHKGQRYNTILCNLEARDVLEVSDGRTKEEVVKLLERLNEPNAVQAVSMDMSASFRPAVQAVLPHAQIVVDHFHVIQHVMKAKRSVLSIWTHKKEGMILLHGKQHLFLRTKEELTEEETRERERIGARLPALEQAWQLKEALRTCSGFRASASKTSYTVHQVLYEDPVDGALDAIIWLGAYRADRAAHAVRLVQFVWEGVTYQYLTNVLSPDVLPLAEIAQLYARRWDIELAFKTLKRETGVALWWGASQELVLIQLWLALILAQVLHALQLILAHSAGVEPFDVSMHLLVEQLGQSRMQGGSMLDLLVEQGRDLGLIRKSSRRQIQVPAEKPECIRSQFEGAPPPRLARYAGRNGHGPRKPFFCRFFTHLFVDRCSIALIRLFMEILQMNYFHPMYQ